MSTTFFYLNQGIAAYEGEISMVFSMNWKLHLRFVHLAFEKMIKLKTNSPKITLLKLMKVVEREVKWEKARKKTLAGT